MRKFIFCFAILFSVIIKAHEGGNFVESDMLASLQPGDKAALLVVHFGTTYPETRQRTIEAINRKIADAFPQLTDTATIPYSDFDFVGQGWNETNTSLSALTKQEYLFGIISPPEVQSDVYIDRGITTVMDRHLKMSEITNLAQLTRYGNGYYKMNKI